MYRSHLNTDNIISNTKTNIYINEVLQNKKNIATYKLEHDCNKQEKKCKHNFNNNY